MPNTMVKVEVEAVEKHLDKSLVSSVQQNKAELLTDYEVNYAGITITEDFGHDNADKLAILLQKVKLAIKLFEETRKFFVKPLNDHVKDINGIIKAAAQPLVNAKNDLEAKSIDWDDLLERKHQEEIEAKLKEEERRQKISVAKGGTGQDLTPVETPVDERKLHRPTPIKMVWTFEVTDVSQLPIDYLLADEVKIRQAMNGAQKHDDTINLEIPGVRFFKKKRF